MLNSFISTRSHNCWVLWCFKLPFETKELFACHASTDNPEFGDSRVDGRLKELDWDQTNVILVRGEQMRGEDRTNFMQTVPKFMQTVPDIS